MAYPGAATFPGSNTYPGLSGSGAIFRAPIHQRRYPLMPPLTVLMNYSVALLRIQGQWVETEYPTEEQINAADYYFPGGYEIPVDDVTAAVLTAAGYTVDGTPDAAPTGPTAPPPPPSSTSALVGTAVVGSSVAA